MSRRAEEQILRSPAKINWLLRVLGRRQDGFHEIETIFQTISLHDRIVCTPSDEFRLTCSDPRVPTDSRNLVARAIELLGRHADNGDIPRFAIHIEKSIPSGGGLGGGSSNAAVILRSFRDRFVPRLPVGELREMSLELGSDVPFFLEGGTSWATGRGEILEPLPRVNGIRLLLLFPEERVSTAEAYSLLGRGPVMEDAKMGIERAKELMDRGPLDEPEPFVNDFEDVIFDRLPNLGALREQLVEEGAAWARMSGSGSTIVGAFRDEETRERAMRAFRGVRVVPAETE